jgi:hypothetical protein
MLAAKAESLHCKAMSIKAATEKLVRLEQHSMSLIHILSSGLGATVE